MSSRTGSEGGSVRLLSAGVLDPAPKKIFEGVGWGLFDDPGGAPTPTRPVRPDRYTYLTRTVLIFLRFYRSEKESQNFGTP